MSASAHLINASWEALFSSVRASRDRTGEDSDKSRDSRLAKRGNRSWMRLGVSEGISARARWTRSGSEREWE